MKLIAIAFLTAGLALPVVVEKAPKKQEVAQHQKEKPAKKGRVKRALKKTGNGFLSAVLFLAEPAR